MDALLALRSSIKEKEIEALLAGEHDPCPCFIEVKLSTVPDLLMSCLLTWLKQVVYLRTSNLIP